MVGICNIITPKVGSFRIWDGIMGREKPVTDILIVEDNQELAGLLCDFLRGEHYIVSIAKNGEQALSMYEKYGARLVVLDIMLPGMDGFAVCKKIREFSNTPIIPHRRYDLYLSENIKAL